MTKAPDLSAEYVRARLNYDPDTGAFTWKSNTPNMQRYVGRAAGTKHCQGYRAINIDCWPFLAHRLAWLITFGEWPKRHIDHINGDRTDNRLANLRDVPQDWNSQNLRKAKSKRPGALLGAYPTQRGGKQWRAIIQIDGRSTTLGYFDTEQEAHLAYLAVKREAHPGCVI